MHICQVVASWGNGGLEKHVIELSNALSREHQVTVIVHPLMKSCFVEAVNVITVDFSQSRWSPRLYWQLLQIINALKPDIVHAQASKAALLVSRLRQWLPLTIKYVATLHNQKGTTSMFEGFDQVIAVSPSIAHLIKKAPVTAIYNGVIAPTPVENGRQLLAQEFGFDAAKPILIAIGRLVDAKGFDILIPAAVRAGVQVLIVGEGERRKLLEAQIVETKARVVLAGFRQDAQRLLAAADSLVISSRNEGGPYTLVEALLVNVPVVSTDVGMVQEFVPEQLIVPVENVEALAERMQWAVSHLAEWRELMQASWQKAQQQLTLEAMVQRAVEVYQRVIQI